MPWGPLAADGAAGRFDAAVVEDARRNWTIAAFQEHRTGAQCSMALEAMFLCKAPVDLVGLFARFPVDEIAHVEMAARMAQELGGALELTHTQSDVVRD